MAACSSTTAFGGETQVPGDHDDELVGCLTPANPCLLGDAMLDDQHDIFSAATQHNASASNPFASVTVKQELVEGEVVAVENVEGSAVAHAKAGADEQEEESSDDENDSGPVEALVKRSVDIDVKALTKSSKTLKTDDLRRVPAAETKGDPEGYKTALGTWSEKRVSTWSREKCMQQIHKVLFFLLVVLVKKKSSVA
jgi:hypothetical protein